MDVNFTELTGKENSGDRGSEQHTVLAETAG